MEFKTIHVFVKDGEYKFDVPVNDDRCENNVTVNNYLVTIFWLIPAITAVYQMIQQG